MRETGLSFEFTPEGKVTCFVCKIKDVPREVLEKAREIVYRYDGSFSKFFTEATETEKAIVVDEALRGVNEEQRALLEAWRKRGKSV